VSQELLTVGKFRLLSCLGIFANGTIYNSPDIDDLPNDLEIDEHMANEVIYLAIDDIDRFEYIAFDQDVANVTPGENESVKISMGKLAVKLVTHFKKEYKNVLPIAKIKAVDTDGNVVLSPRFMPPALDYRVSKTLENELDKLRTIIKKAIINYIKNMDYSGSLTAGRIDTLMQRFSHFCSAMKNFNLEKSVHPKRVYDVMIRLFTDLSFYDINQDLLFNELAYRHDDLEKTFYPLLESIFIVLNKVTQTKALQIRLIEQKKHFWVTEKKIPALCSLEKLILSISATKGLEKIKNYFVHEIIVAPLNKIHHLICHALPGLSIKILKKLPIDLIFEENTLYFEVEIDSKNDLIHQPIACYFNFLVENPKLSLWYSR
jgi:type VI secretion system protein ImpJ